MTFWRAWLSAVALAGGLACGSPPSPGEAPSPALSPDAAALAVPVTPAPRYAEREGRALYAHYCAGCHGADGRGDGFNAYNLDPRPRDLSDAVLQAQRSDQELLAAVRTGGSALGLSPAMPPWGHTLSSRQTLYLVHYLRTLRPEAD